MPEPGHRCATCGKLVSDGEIARGEVVIRAGRYYHREHVQTPQRLGGRRSREVK